ncbi:MAG TPA: phosphohistidine phosphatase SixA [Gemmataceae bacterium]|nr:phosphohistidine phosphatase SixA [Gemmataceae bacterium]
MDLYVIRHADAQPLGEDGIQNDADRPLTKQGLTQCGSLAETLERQGVHLDCIITSPLLRARQTAEGLLEHLAPRKPQLHICDQLAPGGKRKKLTRFLCSFDSPSVAIVGHMPDLGVYLGWLIGSSKAQIDLAKAGVACINFEDELDKGAGALTWMVSPQWYK